MKFNPKSTLIKTFGSTHWLCFIVEPKDVNSIQKVINNEHTVNVDKIKNSRSLQSNAFSWTLIHKMAIKVKSTDDEVYLEMLRRYGPHEYIAAPIEAEEILKRSFKIVKAIKECTLNDTKATTFKLTRGSSTFDPEEMSRYIEGIVDECKTLNIETETPEKLKAMMEEYRKRYENV